MPKFRKKPIVIEAHQWFKNGDHPEDKPEWVTGEDGAPFLSEGKVVRYYRNPTDSGDRRCDKCARTMHDHGWIDTLEGGHIVCPGDWIITDVKGERYPCKPDIFDKTYKPVTEAAEAISGSLRRVADKICEESCYSGWVKIADELRVIADRCEE